MHNPIITYPRLKVFFLLSLLLYLLVLTACGNTTQNAEATTSNTESTVEQSEESAKSGEEKKDEPILRTEQVFDTETYKGQLQIRYFYLEANEKSGDAIYIESPDGVNMLIDAGMKLVGPKVDEYLTNLGVKKLDYAVATHPHHDHIGGYLTILRSKEIGKMFLSNIPHNTETYKTMMQIIDERKINYAYLEDGNVFHLGEEVLVEVLNPVKGTGPDTLPKELSTAEINNNSLVLKLTYKDRTFLFTGDLYKEAEYALIERHKDILDVDVLDTPHHGDQTSSSIELVEATTPKIALMSTNIFQSKNVYDRYRKRDSEVYITGVDGNLLVVSDGKEITVITEKDRVGNYLK